MSAVRAERRGPVALLTLDRPERRNAFDAAMAQELRARLQEAARDAKVGAVVLTGAGATFCAGGDVAAMRDAGRDAPALLNGFIHHFHPAIRLLLTMPKAAVAAVNGAAAGGGYGLALACDLRLAGEQARFKAAYPALGLSPDGGLTWLLPRIVGAARARELILLDEVLDARRALELGVVHRVVEGPKLLDEAVALASRLAQQSRGGFGRTKALLARSPEASLAEQLGAERRGVVANAATSDFREGVEAFHARRPPRFPSAQPQN